MARSKRTQKTQNPSQVCSDASPDLMRAKINLETSRIPWGDLQRHFARGVVMQVSSALDLVEVAFAMSRDRRSEVERWIESSLVFPVSDSQALEWFVTNASVWAVVVKPWVLVQVHREGKPE